MALRACSLSLLLLLAACAAPLQRPPVAEAIPQQASADRFWQHIDADQPGDWFKLLSGGQDSLDWRLAMIDSAHHQIDMESFLWKLDRGGGQVLAHLLAAADRGVQIRILLDDSFTPHEDLDLLAVNAHPNIQLRIYNPYRVRPGGMAGRTLFNLQDFHRVNHRMHNKTLLVDGWAGLVGGRNLADEYFGLHDDYNFRDMEVLALGASVAAVADHFARFWNSAWSFPAEAALAGSAGPGELALLRQRLAEASGPTTIANETQLLARWHAAASSAMPGEALFVADEPAAAGDHFDDMIPDQLAQRIVALLDEAQQEVVLVTAYLVPTAELSAVIRRTLDRGVRVRILTNSLRSNNHLAAYAAYRGYVKELVASGVELYELRTDAVDRNLYMADPVSGKRLGLHAKFMLFDADRVLVGSSNLDPRSLHLNTEVGLVIDSVALNQRLRDAIAVDFLPRNAWSVQLDGQGELAWVGEGERYAQPPADSLFQQLEAWFIGLLPVDEQM